jgi:hypothetical protein
MLFEFGLAEICIMFGILKGLTGRSAMPLTWQRKIISTLIYVRDTSSLQIKIKVRTSSIFVTVEKITILSCNPTP